MSRLTIEDQRLLQEAYIELRVAIQMICKIARPSHLNTALNKLFDAADIIDEYVEPTRRLHNESN